MEIIIWITIITKINYNYCLENLGWLRKNPLNNNYVNWIGNEYMDEIYRKKVERVSFLATIHRRTNELI